MLTLEPAAPLVCPPVKGTFVYYKAGNVERFSSEADEGPAGCKALCCILSQFHVFKSLWGTTGKNPMVVTEFQDVRKVQRSMEKACCAGLYWNWVLSLERGTFHALERAEQRCGRQWVCYLSFYYKNSLSE